MITRDQCFIAYMTRLKSELALTGTDPGYVMQVTGRRRVLAQGPAPAHQAASLGATVWLRPPYSSGSYASLASQLSASNMSTIGSPVHIQGVQGLSKLGIRGNGRCEIGELPGPDNEGEHLLAL